MKKVLAFDVDQTLNVAKMPIPDEIAELLVKCLDHYEICPISGQKYEQFLIQIVNRLEDAGVTPEQLSHLHLFVAQGTQYYRYNVSKKDWDQVYNYPLTDEQVAKITETIEKAAKELGYWEEDKLADGDEIIENRLSQVTFSALGQKAGTEAKYAWDPDHKKREAIVKRCKELAPEFEYEIGGTTSINAITPGMNKVFGMTHLMEELKVEKPEILYFGDMTQPGGNDYPVVQMGIDTITVRSHEDTAYALRGILGVTE
ncbi:HAD-IIB family hydrolase [Candidatus Saccharibacteria bacterium]|nr:HAD-IIB family hydrolase [Candidatus Saccharibacteria bacterium]